MTRRAVVLASSKGIGFGVASALAAKGVEVTITSSRSGVAEERAAALCRTVGVRVTGRQLDLRDDASVEAFIRDTTADQPVDILVLNVPGPPAIALDDFDAAVFTSVLRSGVANPLRIVQALLPGMKTRRFGRVIALTSTTGKEPDAGMIYSNVIRAAMLAYVKTVSRECGPFGITANSILTGGVLTDRLHTLFEADARRQGEDTQALIAAAAAATPVGYFATPDQFAPTVCFLASDESGYLTGAAIPLDGGYMRGL